MMARYQDLINNPFLNIRQGRYTHLVRVDRRTDNIVVIAGEDIVIEIDPTGARKVL